jgi:hypothetical protein
LDKPNTEFPAGVGNEFGLIHAHRVAPDTLAKAVDPDPIATVSVDAAANNMLTDIAFVF